MSEKSKTAPGKSLAFRSQDKASPQFCSDDEYVRQAVMAFLIEKRGWPASALVMDQTFEFALEGERFTARLDLLAREGGRPLAHVMCRRGSLVSRHKEALAASRLLSGGLPLLTVVANSEDAVTMLTASGQELSQGMEGLPAWGRLDGLWMEHGPPAPLAGRKLEAQARILLAFETFVCPGECRIRPVGQPGG